MEGREEVYVNNMKGALKDILTKDLHFVFESSTVSCHQSIIVPRSPFLKDLLASQRCGAGVESVSVFLSGVKYDTVQRLVDYLYTGTCSVRKIKHVMEMIELKKLLQLDINIEKRIYKKEAVEKVPEPPLQPQIVSSESLAPAENEETVETTATETFNDDVNAPDEGQDIPEAASEPEPVRETKTVPPLKLSYVKTEPKSSLNEQLSNPPPYENKIRLKIENNGFNFAAASIFERVVHSITADSDEDEAANENEESGEAVQEQAPIDYESIRQEMYNDVVSGGLSTKDDSNEKHDEKDQSEREKKDDSDSESDSDDEDDDSSSSSSDSSSDEDSEDEAEAEARAEAKARQMENKNKSVEEDDDDSMPGLPLMGDNEDGMMPSIPTSMLIQELENDEKRLNDAISAFLNRNNKDLAGDCSECGHTLSVDNFVLHYGIHLEDIKASKKKLVDGLEIEEQARMEMEAEEELEIPDTNDSGSSYQEPTPPPTPPDQPASSKTSSQQPIKTDVDSVEHKISKLQENQKRLSRDIVAFMAKFQRGAKTLECSECGETVIMTTSVNHFKSHINDLSRKIEILVTSKKDNKRKHEKGRDDVQKKKLRNDSLSKPRPPPQRHSSGSSYKGDGKQRIGTDDERKKMYKRIYGRKKYQYRIQNRGENVTVSEEEIDAEIAKEKAKFSGHPSSGGSGDSEFNLSPQEMLRSFVQFGSKEYKHEFKKARDRLYKRKLRVLRTQGIMDNSAALDIPRADIEVEMLSRYSANKTIKTELERDKDPDPTSEPDQPIQHEVRIKTENSMLEDDLELSLDNVDMGELIAEAQSMLGDSMSMSMSEIVSAVRNVSLPSNDTDNFNNRVKTTLDERVAAPVDTNMICNE